MFNEVAYGGRPAVIKKHGARAVAIVPYGILELLTRVEAALDTAAASAALEGYRREGGISLAELKKQLAVGDD